MNETNPLGRTPSKGNGGFPKLGVPFLGSHNKDSNILGSSLFSETTKCRKEPMNLRGSVLSVAKVHLTLPGDDCSYRV